jgi:hypothetical protein
MKEAQVPPKRRFLQEPHGVTTQKTPFFIVTAVKTSNLTKLLCTWVGGKRNIMSHVLPASCPGTIYCIVQVYVCIDRHTLCMHKMEAHSNIVGWDAVLEARRLQVSFPMR